MDDETLFNIMKRLNDDWEINPNKRNSRRKYRLFDEDISSDEDKDTPIATDFQLAHAIATKQITLQQVEVIAQLICEAAAAICPWLPKPSTETPSA